MCAQVDTCSTAALRTLNAVLSVACLACFAVTYAQLHPRLSVMRCMAAVSTRIWRLIITLRQLTLGNAMLSLARRATRLDSYVGPSQGVTMALFPLHFFFTALYYTDTGSTLLVIGAHLLALRGWYLPAGLAAAAATGFRQTNAVWAAFTFAVRQVAGESLNCNPVRLI